MSFKKIFTIIMFVLAAGGFVIGCSTPDKVIGDSLKGTGDVAKGMADSTGNMAKGAADATGNLTAGVAGGAGTVIKPVADTTGTVVKTAADVVGDSPLGKTMDDVGKEIGKKRDVDVMGQPVQVDMKQDKKIKIEF